MASIATWSADWNAQLKTFVQAQHAFRQSFDDRAKDFSGYTLVDATASYRLPKGELRLAVANRGPGIDAARLARMGDQAGIGEDHRMNARLMRVGHRPVPEHLRACAWEGIDRDQHIRAPGTGIGHTLGQ